MFHCSAAEGQRFQQEMIRISEIIENLGSNPIKESLSIDNDKGSERPKKKKTE